MTILWFICGMLLGFFLGVVTAGVIAAGARDEREHERALQEQRDQAPRDADDWSAYEGTDDEVL